VKGYQVVSTVGRQIGRVTEARGGFLVVEQLGRVIRTRFALPTEFAHTTDGERKVVVTAPIALLEDAPRVGPDGIFDANAAARHFGVAATM
jgi:hypothetical protein